MKQYDIFELSKDINPKIKKGKRGVVLQIYTDGIFEVEFVNDDGLNIEYEGHSTFTIDLSYIKMFE